MFNIATNQIAKTNKYTPKDSMKYVAAMCLLLAVLIFGRAANDVIFYVFAAVSLLVILVSSISVCFSTLLFLLPFAGILKVDVEGISFFTILFFVFVLKLIFVKKTIRANLLLALSLFAVYSLCVSGIEEMETVITMAAGMLMLYYLQTSDVNIESSVLAFTIGIVLSSVLVLLKSVFPIVNTFVVDSVIKHNGELLAIRFAGLQGNPNYYTLDITIALAIVVIQMYRKSNMAVNVACFIALSVFGLMSISKSFLLCWILLIVFWLCLSMKQGIGRFMKFLIIAIICGAAIYFYAFDAINGYIFRFIETGGGTLGNLTTGRTDIWKRYIDVIFNDAKILFFGNGLNTVIMGMKATHNTYLEALYALGIFGSILFVFSLKTCMGKIVSKPIMLVPVVLLLVRMFAISILTYDNLWFYVAIIVCMSKYLETVEGGARKPGSATEGREA